MKKKSVLNYADTCLRSIQYSRYDTYDAQLDDLYDEIQALAASLKVFKDFNVEEDFYKGMKRIRAQL